MKHKYMADNDELMKQIIRVIITLIILAIVKAVINSLPGINTAIPGMILSIPTIISLIISTIMIVVVWRFGVTIGPIVQKQYPNFSELRSVATNISYLICLIIAYGAYRSVLNQFFYNLTWIYDIAFLLVGLYLVYIIAMPLLKSTDKISEVISSNVKQATTMVKTCKKCGTENPSSNKFCDKCGTALDV
jgi:ribosomal protein L40E